MKAVKRERLLFAPPRRWAAQRTVKVRSSHYARYCNREWRHKARQMIRAGDYDGLPLKPQALEIW